MKKKILYIPAVLVLLWTAFTGAVRIAVRDVVSDDVVGRAYVLRMNDVIYMNKDIEDIDKAVELQNSMQKDPAIRSITMKYMDAAVQSIAYDMPFAAPDIAKQEDKLASHVCAKTEKEGITLDRDLLQESITDATDSLTYAVQSMTSDGWYDYAVPWLRPAASLWYYTVTPGFALCLTVCGIFFLTCATKMNDISTTGKTVILTGGLELVLGFMTAGGSLALTNKILGRSLFLSLTPFLCMGVAIILCGVFLYRMGKRKYLK